MESAAASVKHRSRRISVCVSAGRRVGCSPATAARRILIGKDTRVSGYMFESVLEAGLVSAGVDVRLLGPMPTPAVAYLTRTLRADAGIVISASHNPFYDNGIKFFDCDGNKLPDEKELAIEAELESPDARASHPKPSARSKRVEDARGRYIEFCKATVDRESAAERMQDRARLRERRDVRRGAGRIRGTRCRHHGHWRRARWT